MFLSAVLFGTGFFLGRRQREKAAQAEVAMQEALDDARGASMLVQIGPSLAGLRADIVVALRRARAETAEELGIALPKLEVIDVASPQVGLRVEMDRVQMLSAQITGDELWTDRLPATYANLAQPRPGPGGLDWLVVARRCCRQDAGR